MHSEFNTAYTKILEEMNGMSLSDVGDVYKSEKNTTPQNTPSQNTPTKIKGTGMVKSLMNSLPDVMKTLNSQAKLWYGEADIRLNELGEMLKGYNEKKALNALYGIIDYMKAKKPILMMQDNDMIRTIKQQLLQKQNEKQ